MSKICNEVEEQLSGYLDGELTQQESQKIHLHLESCQSCQSIYRDLKSMQHSIAQLEKPTMSEVELKHIMQDRPAIGMQWIGWMMLIAGISVIVGFVAYQFFTSDEAFLIKLVVSSIYGGLAFLFLTVLRQRFIARKTDRYKGVDL